MQRIQPPRRGRGWFVAYLPTLLAALAALSFTPALRAQTAFSIEYRSASIATLDSCTGVPITEGDILVPATAGGFPALGPLPPPCIFISAAAAGGLALPLGPGCIGHPPGFPCGVEVDAISFGTDGPAIPGMPPGSWWFSPDQFAVGIAGTPAPPAVWTEGVPAPAEAGADVFIDFALPAGPIPPGPVFGNTGAIDGNGLAGPSPFAYPGTGLLEPIPPPLCPPPDPGDNLDAVDVDGPLGAAVIFFSLDAGFVDPLCGIPYSGSAVANGFLPGMVLFKTPFMAAPAVFAPPAPLGLDLFGAGTDDLDALALCENGTGVFEPSPGPYVGWCAGTDMLLFSVRRGSAVVGAPDSIFGAPIEPGDILIPPVAGGVSPFPGIFIAAESIGFATMRAGLVPFGDELDALDVLRQPLFDCNGNGIEDAFDIASGASCDVNGNRVPDECECVATIYCVPKVNSAGCTPAIGFSGFASASCTIPFNITATSVLDSKNGLFFYSLTGMAAVPFQCGTLCVKAPIRRTPVQSSGGTPPCGGSYSIDFNAWIQSGIDPGLVVGAVVDGQYWSRDPGFAPPCNTGLTDAIDFTICP